MGCFIGDGAEKKMYIFKQIETLSWIPRMAAD